MSRRSELFWERVETFTPGLCRMLARHKAGLPFTSEEVSIKSGNAISPYEVFLITQVDNWSDVTVGKMQSFLRGCGIDFSDRTSMHRMTEYLRASGFNKKSRFKYLIKSPEWETVFEPLVRKLGERGQ